jgi:hypothetical protein
MKGSRTSTLVLFRKTLKIGSCYKKKYNIGRHKKRDSEAISLKNVLEYF